jgi:hypothetical protein
LDISWIFLGYFPRNMITVTFLTLLQQNMTPLFMDLLGG